MPLYWSPDYVVASEDFDTTRKSGWIAESCLARIVRSAAGPLGTRRRWLARGLEAYLAAEASDGYRGREPT